jgi:2-phosphosulfolactate phosphatase
MKIDVAFLPCDLDGTDLSNTVCIVLDIFRATSSIVTAFDNGCREIVPVCTIDEAWITAKQQNEAKLLLAGERKGGRIEGFHLGNSPLEFTLDKVFEKTIVMTTTNGTIAIKATEGAYRTLIGCFLNADAVYRRAKQYGKNVLVVCAGTDRHFSLEDALCAGMLVDAIWEEGQATLTDAARGALLMYAEVADAVDKVAANSSHGRYLYDIGYGDDIKACIRINMVDVVPEYRDGIITLI